MDKNIKQDPASALGVIYGVASAQAIASGLVNSWWYRVENIDGAPFPIEVEIIGFCEDPEAKIYAWPDKRVFKIVSFVRDGLKHPELEKRMSGNY